MALTRTSADGGRLLVFQPELRDLLTIAAPWKRAIRERSEVAFPLGSRGRLEALVSKTEGADGPLTVSLKEFSDSRSKGSMMHLYGGEFSALIKTVRGTEIFFSTDKVEVTMSSSDDDDRRRRQ